MRSIGILTGRHSGAQRYRRLTEPGGAGVAHWAGDRESRVLYRVGDDVFST